MRKKLIKNLKECIFKDIIKITFPLPEVHNHQVGSTAKEILKLKREIKVKTLGLIEVGLHKKPVLKDVVEKFISKELEKVKDQIPEENFIEIYPKDSFYKGLLSSYNREITESEDIIELKSMLCFWEEQNTNNKYTFIKQDIDGSFMLILQTEKQKEILKR